MMMHSDALADLQARVDLYALASRYTPLKRKGQREWTRPCPFCGQGRDRFNVQPNEHRWLCRCGCRRTTNSRWHDAWAFFAALHHDDAKAGLAALRAYSQGSP